MKIMGETEMLLKLSIKKFTALTVLATALTIILLVAPAPGHTAENETVFYKWADAIQSVGRRSVYFHEFPSFPENPDNQIVIEDPENVRLVYNGINSWWYPAYNYGPATKTKFLLPKPAIEFRVYFFPSSGRWRMVARNDAGAEVAVVLPEHLHSPHRQWATIKSPTEGVSFTSVSLERAAGATSTSLSLDFGRQYGGHGGFYVVYGGGPIDTDGDGVPDDEDAFPNDPTETIDTDADGVGDNSDAFPLDPTESADSDADGVGENADLCLGTTADSAGGGKPLKNNHFSDIDGDGVFNTSNKSKKAFTVFATKGCSCDQIIDVMKLGKGHQKNGCSGGEIELFIDTHVN